MSLSSIDQVEKNSQMYNDDFSMVDTYGKMIVNEGYGKGYRDFAKGLDTRDAFIYKALSAAGTDVADTLYLNIKKYISLVSDVNLCKLTGLRSMLNMFGFSHTIYDNLESLPLGIRNLMDLLSINRKYLLKKDLLRDEILDDLSRDDEYNDHPTPIFEDDGTKTRRRTNIKSFFTHNCYTLSALDNVASFNDVQMNKLLGTYECSGNLLSAPFEMFEDIPLSTCAEISNATTYMNSSGYFMSLVELSNSTQSCYTVYDENAHKILAIDRSTIDGLSVATDTVGLLISDLYNYALDNQISDANFAFMQANRDNLMSVTLSNSHYVDDLYRIDDDEYLEYLKYIYARYIGFQLSNVYNASFVENTYRLSSYIYPHLGDMYFEDSIEDKYETFRGLSEEDSILSLKMFYHVPKSFDENKIYDNIENGDDSLDNYAGAELSILLAVKDQREQPLDFSKLTEFGTYGIEGNASKIPQTRYSYYREKKVAEYAKFVDNYYSSINLDLNIYDFDTNYFLMSSDVSQHVINVVDERNPNPSTDIDWSMVDAVADYLSQLTLYSSKIRDKIKLQTQKNYMKGTNLLIIYVINEYLNEYAKHNSKLFLETDENGEYKYPELALSVYPMLNGHQFSDDGGQTYSIDVGEYYDKTEYFNISTETSPYSNGSQNVNSRYWELTSASKPSMMGYDGLSFKLSEIEKFYLSTLNLRQTIDDSHDGIVDFLSTLYDLGANTSFVRDGDGLFSSKLADGNYAHEIYDRLVALSNAFLSFKQYLSAEDYTYVDGTVSAQVSSALKDYIFPNLSTSWLSAVSTVYDANIDSIEEVSTSMMELSTDYNNFISGTYSYYYVKSNNKWCYEYQDAMAGSYLYNYYVKSPDYDTLDMTLYQHLQSLSAYTSDQSNIVNHALIAVTDYLYSTFNSISSTLKSKVVSPLTNNYNFVDIAAPVLGDELQYTYDYVTDLISSRKQQIENAIANLKTQASTLKSSYESLNNTFTNAIASFNDNYDGYALGDQCIYEFCVGKFTFPSSSVVEHEGLESEETGTCDAKTEQPTKVHDRVIYAKEVGLWYMLGDSGDYGYSKNKIDDDLVYSASSTLEERCNQVKTYINAPTTVQSDGTEQYGLRNEGINSVVDNVLQGIESLKTTFDSISTLAEAYGVDTGWEATDINGKIDELISKLNAIDPTMVDDNSLNTLNSLLKQITQLSSTYLPLKEQYEGVFSDSEQSEYLTDFTPNMSLTLAHIQDLKDYTTNTDRNNYNSVLDSVNQLANARFDELMENTYAVVDAMHDNGIVVQYPSDMVVEKYISQLVNTLLQDVADKIEYGMTQINTEKQNIYEYIATMYSEIYDDIFTSNGFEQSVEAALAKLNFFEHEIYQKWQKVFLTYGGQEICYDPYYNMKNQVHASYQVHPFLWNLVKKANTDTLIERGFKAGTNIGEEYTLQGLNSYIGEFGQSIDLWKNYSKGRIDYSGYSTRYEKSDNKSSATGDVNEVVGYDGAFYPPAIDQFTLNSTACINAVSGSITVYDVQQKISNRLDNAISSYLQYDSDGNITGNTIYSTIEDIVDQYVVSNNIQSKIDEYIASTEVSSLDISDVKSIIGYDIASTSTFYEKYYKHLSLSKKQYQHIAQQLDEYKDQIFDITECKTPKTVYDIYKYGLDKYGNSYILYKQYDYSDVEQIDDLTFQQKRNTLGTMWIRLSEHPIAFPAFSGTNPAYYMYKTTEINPALLKLAIQEDGIVYEDKYKVKISSISSKMKFFFDFEFTQDQTALMYVVKNGNMPDKTPFNQFGLGWVITDRIHTTYDTDKGLEWLQFTNSSSSGTYTIDYIDFDDKDGRLTHYRNKHSLLECLEQGVRYPVLVGYYPYDQFCIDLVYVYKKFKYEEDEDGNIYVDVTISNMDDKDTRISANGYDLVKAFFLIQIKNGTSIKAIPTSGSSKISTLKSNNLATVGDCACIGWDSNTRSTKLAFLTQLSNSLSNIVDVNSAVSSIDFDINTEGATIDDPMAPEMNSHDIFNQNVTILSFKHKNSEMKFQNSGNYNINADISYIPSYPGTSGEVDIWSNWSSSHDYYNIELLGMSKDIDSYIGMVNPDPDPYFDYNTIVENTVFGRVWEDYNSNENIDKTFCQFVNPALNNNMPSDDGTSISKYSLYNDEVNNEFRLTWNLENMFGHATSYSEHDYETLQLIVFKQGALGKNPYFVGSLKDLLADSESLGNWKTLNYNGQPSDVATTTIESDSFSSSYTFTASGTRRLVGQSNFSDCNGFDHIQSIEAIFNKHTKNFILRFKHDGSQYAHVPYGAITFVLYNVNDLSLFKYYHMLDAHGVVQCKYLEEYLENPDLNFDGWSICYDSSKFKHEQISDLLKSFYIDQGGGKHYLADVDMSQYDNLSDVYILNGTQRLGFKVDEQIYFDISSSLYWYPTLNISYPQQPANYIYLDSSFQSTDSTNLGLLSGVYGDYNMFIVAYDDPYSITENIGQVDIPIMYNDIDDIRVYEDFLSTDVNGYSNYEKYGLGDSRLLEFVHATSQKIGCSYTDINPLTVEDSTWKNISLSDVSLPSKYPNIEMKKSETVAKDNTIEYMSLNVTSSNCDIVEQLKIYASYKRDRNDDDSLTLYFNYFNYLNSPYLKIDNGCQTKLDTIDGTYLKLKAGEDGLLDIVVQFRSYNGKQLVGYKNCKIATYHIYNISDDKPKFLIQKVFFAEKDSFKNKPNAANVNLNVVVESVVDIGQYSASSQKIDLPVDLVVDYDKQLSSAWDFYMYYPNNILSIDTSSDAITNGYYFDQENCDLGLLHIVVDNTTMQSFQFNFFTIGGYVELLRNANRVFDIQLDEPTIFDIDGLNANVEYEDASFVLKKDNIGVLDANTKKTPSTNSISAIIIDRLNTLIQLD